MSTFRALWPVVDPDMTLQALKTEALADLPDMLFEQHLQQAGEITWTVEELPGLYLQALVPVATWSDPARHGGLRRAAWRVAP